MTISIIGVGTYPTGTGNLTPTLHASTAEGDLLIAFSNKRAADQFLAPPGEWVELYQHSETDTAGTAGEMTFYGKIAGASESSPTFTATGVSTGSVQVLTVRSTQSFNISDIANTSAENKIWADNITAASITPTVDNCLALFGGKIRDTADGTTASALSGTTELGTSSGGGTASLFTVWNYVIQGAAAPLTPGDWTITGTSQPNTTAAISVALKETASAATVAPAAGAVTVQGQAPIAYIPPRRMTLDVIIR